MSWNKQWIVLGLVVVVGLTPAGSTWAGVAPSFGNGNFETGDLSNWFWAGDVGVANFNVINGSYSAFITTGVAAVGGMCSFLMSNPIFPTVTPQSIQVSFKVRYKTNEGIAPYAFEDPFSAELITGLGTVDLLTIKADGVTPGPGTTVINTATGFPLPPPPTVPPIAVVGGLYLNETPTLQAISQIPYTSCNPVAIKFTICDFFDAGNDSAAFLDDVSITAVTTGIGWGGGGTPCPPPAAGLLQRVPPYTRK